ncbi:hypothetical protein D3C73_1260870 [compost metagenome]
MRASGLQLQFQQSTIAKTLQHGKMSHRTFAVLLGYGIELAVMRITADRRIHRSLIMGQITVHYSYVAAGYAVLLELGCE